MVLEINGYDGLVELVGQELGKSEWFEITQEAVNQFADATGDHQWIHIDVEKAKSGPFGGTIAHGFMTLSLVPVLSAQVQKITGMKMAVNYGCNKVRFPSPVPVGSKVRDTIVLKEVNRKSSGIQVIMENTIEIEGGDRPACVAECITVFVEE